MRFILLFSTLITMNAIANDKCSDEKDEADYWNNKLLERVDEYRRERHRDAKNEYLKCLRKPTLREKKKSTSATRKQVQANPSKRKIRISKNASTTGFANFKGSKRDAWLAFFKESHRCIDNKSNMAVFVECSKIRKKHLAEFESRWDETTQSLMTIVQ